MTVPWPLDHRQEREWLAQLRSSHIDTFRQIFETFAPRLQHFALIWVSSDVAEDLVQDVLFDLWQRRETLDIDDKHLTAYLFTAVRKRAAHHLRHQGVVRRIEDDTTLYDPPGMGTAPDTPDAYTIANDIDTLLESMVARLSPMQRSVLMLRWTQGLSFFEIAAILSLSENAAKLHMSRARQALRPFLREILEEMT